MKVICYTNLDNLKREEWPERLAAVPSIGHRIRAKSGKTLKITSLTWTFNGILEIELHNAI